MVSIKDIYQWSDLRKGEPLPPKNPPLTPLQLIEWKNQNSKELYAFHHKSFVGEILIAAPANISNIRIDKIIARADYKGDYYRNMREPHEPRLETILMVEYEIFFDESLYETVKTIHNNSTVEIEGKITNFKAESKLTGAADWDIYIRHYYITLNLSKIKVIASQSLSAETLDDIFKPKTVSASNISNCFIATAAFGNQDVTEVIQLREFRDNVLKNTTAGRWFIFIYTFLSPPIASVIRQSNWLRRVTRRFLRKVILPMVIRNTN